MLITATSTLAFVTGPSTYASTSITQQAMKSAHGHARLRTYPTSNPLVNFPTITTNHRRNSRTSIYMSLSSSAMKANLAVSLDTPLFPFTISPSSKSLIRNPFSLAFWRSLLTILVSDAFKTAVVAFILAFALSLLARSAHFAKTRSVSQGNQGFFDSIRWKVIQFMSNSKTKTRSTTETTTAKEEEETKSVDTGIPLEFEIGEDGQEEWKTSTLYSKKAIGDTSYIQYDFQLPHPENTLPLALGQKLELCCLSDDNEVAQGGFYLFSKRGQKGKFSIMAPKTDGRKNRVKFELGKATSKFVSSLVQS